MLSKYRILTLNEIAPKGLALLPPDQYEVASEFSDPDAILVRSANLHERPLNPRLKAIARAGAGVNNIPVNLCSQRGIAVFNTPGANANAVKELVLAGMLVAARNVCEAAAFVRALDVPAERLADEVERAKKRFRGFELAGRTLGVIGLGAIGVRVANMAIELGMTVIGYDPAISVRAAWQLDSRVEQALSLESLLQQSDFVSLHVPLLDSTRHLINADRLAHMRTGSVLLNFSRGEIVDEAALEPALEQGAPARYVSDFPSARLKGHPRVISLPHLGASTEESEENCAVMAVQQLQDFLERGTVHRSVNLPEVELGAIPEGAHRIAIVNDNDAGMIAAMTRVLGEAKLNIEDMINRARDELAYTLIDVTGPLADQGLDALRAVPGVRSVRVCH